MRTRTAFSFLLICLLSDLNQGKAQLASRSPSKFWTAQWITAPDVPQHGEAVLHFRKVLELAEVPSHFVVHVSADNQFIFCVNQQRVGSGPSRSDLWHWRYETYDIATMLHAGKNLLAATVWNFGTNSAIAQMSSRIAFLVHGAGEAERQADTNASWEVEPEKGIESVRPAVRGYYAAEPGERLIGEVFDWSWQFYPGRGGSWTHPVLLGRGALREETDAPNNWQLVADTLPAMEMKQAPAGRVVRAVGVEAPKGFPEQEFTVPPRSTASLLIDNSELTTAYPVLSVSGGLGASVRLTYAEALVDANGAKGNRNEIEGKHITGLNDEFLPSGQPASEFMPLAWRTWRYVQLDIRTAAQPLIIDRFGQWFTAYPFTERAHFSSDDETLSRIWQVGWRTARLDAHDTYMDTPYWERLQYVGDTRIQALISYTVASDDRLARQAIGAYNDSRLPEGLTQSRYPSSLTQIIPTFSLLWIGMVHDFWIYRGDADFVRDQLQGIRAVLDWYLHRLRADGLLQKLPWWPFVDWGRDFDFGMAPQDEEGGSSVITLQFIEGLRSAADIEDALGDRHYAQMYRAVAGRAAKAVYRECWNRQYGLLADTPAQKHFSQHANILGAWLDVIPAEQQGPVLTKILAASNDGDLPGGTKIPSMTLATYYFRFYLARALEHAGMGDQYLRLLGPWKNMLSLGLTTWAESPEPTRSDSHAWSAHINYDLLTVVAGIHPQTPGFKTVRIEPHPGQLKHMSAAMPVPQGVLEVEYSRTPSAREVEISLPAGVSGELVWKGKQMPLRQGRQKQALPFEP
jgi:hypothetical protein